MASHAFATHYMPLLLLLLLLADLGWDEPPLSERFYATPVTTTLGKR